MPLVLLNKEGTDRLIHYDVCNLTSDHEAANQDQATQFCFFYQDPGKYADPDQQTGHDSCVGCYVKAPH